MSNVLGTNEDGLFSVTTDDRGPVQFFTVPSGTGAVIPPLTNTFVVDVGTAVATPDQNGSFAAPFATFAQAIAAITSEGTILVVSGSYYSQGPMNLGVIGTLAVVNLSGLWNNAADGNQDETVILPTISSFTPIRFQGVALDGNVSVNGDVQIDHCDVAATIDSQGLFASDCSFEAEQTPVLNSAFTRCQFAGGDNPVTILNTPYTSVPSFVDCTFGNNCNIIFASGTGVAVFDETSLLSFYQNHGTISNGVYQVIYSPFTGIFIQNAMSLPTGQNLLATVLLPDIYPSDVGVFVACAGVSKTDGVIYSGAYIIATHSVELYADNYTGAPLAGYPGATLRWKVFAP